MASVVYSTGPGAIRARIIASGQALSVFRKGEQNKMIRAALVHAGNKWIEKFKPLRFTKYVTRRPFNYPKRPVDLAVLKLRKSEPPSPLAFIWQRIKQRDFDGWDPWGKSPIPRSLEQKMMAQNPGLFLYTLGKKRGGIHWRELWDHIRKWAKNRAREYADNFTEDGQILPLVMQGKLRDEYSAKSRAVATSTAKGARLTITIPRGNRQNKWAVSLIPLLPRWEEEAIVKWFDVELQRQISTRPKTTQAPTRQQTKTGPARLTYDGGARGAA